jgi:hypothetical protein
MPRYDQGQPSDQYRRREEPPVDQGERGIVDIDYSIESQNQDRLEYRL